MKKIKGLKTNNVSHHTHKMNRNPSPFGTTRAARTVHSFRRGRLAQPQMTLLSLGSEVYTHLQQKLTCILRHKSHFGCTCASPPGIHVWG